MRGYEAKRIRGRSTVVDLTLPPKPRKTGSPQNRACELIDQGNTIADLRRAWGIPERKE